MRRLNDDKGLTLVELLIASLVSFMILAATLTALEAMMRQSAQTEAQTEVETAARQGVDGLARQLRNLASPADVVTNIGASTQPKSVDRNLATDLIFKDVGETKPAGSANSANVRRVRYCLQSSGAVPGAGFTASPSRQVLWMQVQTWTAATPPAMPTDEACPGSGWTSRRVVADHIVNDAATPLFVYSGDTGVVTGTTAADRERIARVTATLEVDFDAARPPAATAVTTGVVLRNQNRAPVARFVSTLLNPVTCTLQLNGSSSDDPESKPLQFIWQLDGVDAPALGGGVVVQTTVPPGTHQYSLKVKDPAGLVGNSSQETFTC